MRLPVLAADKANHRVYGSWVACAAIVATILLAVLLKVPILFLLSPVVGLLVAYAVGKANEMSDQEANDAARRAGHAPPHEVSAADVGATVKGGLPVVLPWLVLMLLGLVRHG